MQNVMYLTLLLSGFCDHDLQTCCVCKVASLFLLNPQAFSSERAQLPTGDTFQLFR